MDKRSDSTDLPADLKRELRGLYQPGEQGGISSRRDAEILAAAREAGMQHHVGASRLWRRAGAIGIAAAVALAAGVLWNQFGSHDPKVLQLVAMPRKAETIYVRTGDIRDAFYVARRLKAHEALESGWDANGDGVIDDADVQALALVAVKVEKIEKGAMQ